MDTLDDTDEGLLQCVENLKILTILGETVQKNRSKKGQHENRIRHIRHANRKYI